ncbi:MAG: cyclic nucleotide-binding domain-containing protein [Spirochaetes bacterium]|nr:cyclic nucleotide-binding domain-containing protein [Spirochaetota bacterium]
MAKKKYKKGEHILHEGTFGKEIYVIVKGKVKVYKTIANERVELATLGQDDFFGEMSLFLNLPRTASIEAIEDTEIVISNLDEFTSIIREDPELATQIIKTMAKRLHEAHNVIVKQEGEKKSLKIMYGI